MSIKEQRNPHLPLKKDVVTVDNKITAPRIIINRTLRLIAIIELGDNANQLT